MICDPHGRLCAASPGPACLPHLPRRHELIPATAVYACPCCAYHTLAATDPGTRQRWQCVHWSEIPDLVLDMCARLSGIFSFGNFESFRYYLSTYLRMSMRDSGDDSAFLRGQDAPCVRARRRDRAARARPDTRALRCRARLPRLLNRFKVGAKFTRTSVTKLHGSMMIASQCSPAKADGKCTE